MYINQSQRIDFKGRGPKIVLYYQSPEGASMVDAGGKIFVFWFSRAQENAFPDAFLRFAMVFFKGTNGL